MDLASVDRAVSSLSQQELYDVVYQTKELVQRNPDLARKILVAHAPLAQALLQAQIVNIYMLCVRLSKCCDLNFDIFLLTSETRHAQGTRSKIAGTLFWYTPRPVLIFEVYQEQPSQQSKDIQQRQRELLQRVQQMTPEIIATLPEDQQKQVKLLRQQLGVQ